MKKALIWILAILVVIAGGVVLFLNYGANSAIQKALESEGSRMTESQVRVKDVSLSLMGGSIALSGVEVANPPGYGTPQAINLGKINVVVDRNSLFSDRIVIKEIRVDNPSITLEKIGKTTNLQALQDAIGRNAPPADETAEPIKVLINDIYVNATTLNYKLSKAGSQKSMSLPDVHLQNIGTGGEGVDVKAAINQVVAQMTPVVMAELVKLEGIGVVKDSLGKVGNLDNLLKDGGGDLLKGAGESGGKLFDKLR